MDVSKIKVIAASFLIAGLSIPTVNAALVGRLPTTMGGIDYCKEAA